MHPAGRVLAGAGAVAVIAAWSRRYCGIFLASLILSKETSVETQQVVQIVAGILAVICVVIVVLRRKKKKTNVEDDF